MSEQQAARRKKWTLRRLAFFAGGLVLLLLLSVVALGAWTNHKLSASLPQLDGELALDCLDASARIERDANGFPRIVAASRADLACALGFAHGQDRFFQMDLLRREAAGELSELLGAATVGSDRAARLHRFRDVARQIVAAAPPEMVELLERYADGVNAALAEQGPPPEYLALGLADGLGGPKVEPRPWAVEDPLVVTAAMYRQLQPSSASLEVERARWKAVTPPELFAFFTPRGTTWDAPLFGPPLIGPPVPGPEVFDLREESLAEVATLLPEPEWTESGLDPHETVIGSNNWAVGATHSADGHAWVANDMHLGLSMPGIWYRAEMRVERGGSDDQLLVGVTLPGAPFLVAGSNGHIAWGFTNVQGDFGDAVLIEVDPDDPSRYLTPDGPEPFVDHDESIVVLGSDPVVETVRWTRWGPIFTETEAGQPIAYRWTAHTPDGLNVQLSDLEGVRTVEMALDVARSVGVPHQNLAIVDRDGNVGWTVIGRIPRRVGFDGSEPVSWADGTKGWQGWLGPGEVPQLINPDHGKIWTANNRVVDEEGLEVIGFGGYASGVRANLIHRSLMAAGDQVSRDTLLRIHLEDSAEFLERWRGLLLSVLSDDAVRGNEQRLRLREFVKTWDARASVDSQAFRLTRAFRIYTTRLVLEPFEFARRVGRQTEGPVWELLTDQPPHLLSPEHESWDALLLAGVDRTIDELMIGDDGTPRPDESFAWGARNQIGLQHPLSQAVPQLAPMLDIPARALSGSSYSPKVLTPGWGASERFAISPGREEEGYLHVPGGPSGHFRSPYYRTGHDDWAEGRPTPLLTGDAKHTLTLTPPG